MEVKDIIKDVVSKKITVDGAAQKVISEALEYGVRFGEYGGSVKETIAQCEIAEKVKEIREEKKVENKSDLEVKCACGHMCPISQRMSTSSGSSCSDCYDRMSL